MLSREMQTCQRVRRKYDCAARSCPTSCPAFAPALGANTHARHAMPKSKCLLQRIFCRRPPRNYYSISSPPGRRKEAWVAGGDPLGRNPTPHATTPSKTPPWRIDQQRDALPCREPTSPRAKIILLGSPAYSLEQIINAVTYSTRDGCSAGNFGRDGRVVWRVVAFARDQ
jgi:hypothetical protein